MTSCELNTLYTNANNGDIESSIQLCELYLSDYVEKRIKNSVDACNRNLNKFIWQLVKSSFTDIVSSDQNIKILVKGIDDNPSVRKIQDLLKALINDANSISKDRALDMSIGIQKAFAFWGSTIEKWLPSELGEYFNRDDVKREISKFNKKPALSSYIEFLKSIIGFKDTIDTTNSVRHLLSYLLDNYKAIYKLPNAEDLEKRCQVISNKIGCDKQFEFVVTEFNAECGDSDAMVDLAIKFEYGIGTFPNEDKAKVYFLRAISKNHPKAQDLFDQLKQKQLHRQNAELQRYKIQQETLRAEKENETRMMIEEDRLAEERRHNHEMEAAQRENIETAKKNAELLREASRNPLDDDIEVEFFWYWNNDVGNRMLKEREMTIKRSEYNALITGGASSIASYIASNFFDRYNTIEDPSVRIR